MHNLRLLRLCVSALKLAVIKVFICNHWICSFPKRGRITHCWIVAAGANSNGLAWSRWCAQKRRPCGNHDCPNATGMPLTPCLNTAARVKTGANSTPILRTGRCVTPTWSLWRDSRRFVTLGSFPNKPRNGIGLAGWCGAQRHNRGFSTCSPTPTWLRWRRRTRRRGLPRPAARRGSGAGCQMRRP